MSAAILGVKGSGGIGAWPQLQRVINASASVLGESFGTVLLTGAPSGTFTVGEALSFSGGGTATLAQSQLTGPDRLVISSPSGVISGTITGLSSGVTAVFSSAEGAYTHPSSDGNQFTHQAIEFSNRVFCLHGNTVYRLNEALGVSGGRCEEVHRLSTTRNIYLQDSALNGGMFVIYVGGIPTLITFYTPDLSAGGVVRLKTTDGVTWSATSIVPTDPRFTTAASGPAMVLNNNIYWVGTTATSANAIYDSSTDTMSEGPTASPAIDARRSLLFTWDNRLFSINDSGTYISVDELIAGSWSNVDTLAGGGAVSRNFVVPGNDGAMYLISTDVNGFRSWRFGLSGGTIEVTRGVLPVGLYTGSGSVTDGWSVEVYTDKEFNDSTADDGPAESFVFLSTNDSSGTIRTCYKWTDDIAYQHQDVRAASMTALPANTASGSGPGKTLTATINGALLVDGVSVSATDRVLVGNESSAFNNGIYEVTNPGSGTEPYVLTRTTDFDAVSSGEVETGAWVFSTEGSSWAGYRWVMTTAGTIVLEATGLVWTSTPILTLQDSGCPQQIRLPHTTYSGGEYSFSPGGLDIRITGIAPIPGGERISYRIYKTPGSPDVTNLKIRFLYRLAADDSNGRVPGRWGYIGATSVGSISGGNREVTGLTGDSEQGTGGGTVYTIDWLALSQDGLSNYLPVGRKLVVYV